MSQDYKLGQRKHVYRLKLV